MSTPTFSVFRKFASFEGYGRLSPSIFSARFGEDFSVPVRIEQGCDGEYWYTFRHREDFEAVAQ